jgi:hypothetical protein
MFEHHRQPLVSAWTFTRRLARSIGVASLLVSVSLMAGMVGYHTFEDLPWVDAYIEAAMILSGMGPTAAMHSTAGKIFSGTYALYSGLMLILIVGVIVAPIAHRFFHKFHLEVGKKDS